MFLKIFPSAILALFLGFSAGAATPAYEVTGLNRTTPAFFDHIIRFCSEKATLEAASLKQCVYDFRIFSSVEIEKSPEGKFHVFVQERWTLFPIPMMYVSNDIRRYGFFVFESNFLGRGKVFGGGLAVSNAGNTYFILYRDPAVNYSPFTLTLRAALDSQDVYAYAGKIKAYGYKEDRQGIVVAPGLRLNPYWSLSVEPEWVRRNFKSAGFDGTPDDYSTIDGGIRLQYQDTAYRLFFNEGFSADLRLKRQLYKSDDQARATTIESSVAWEKSAFFTHVFQFSGRIASLYGADPRDLIRTGYMRGYRGIEANGLWLRKTLALSFDYQIPLASVASGVWTLAPFVDLGWFKSTVDTSREAYQSYGLGTYFFISRIALPGMGLIAGHNAEYKGNFVAFFLGMPMR
ncbi:MAG: hypothetical protein A2070_07880 [Bdellovibrionales bacterium GWC1_52_8]|nr:MAG: hypothetical protein A2Z97_13915 [Bdellovibrionales bacterium GWB1_52_6]OFZ06398.1 MAG: hypothetical protein A2X97_02965 [Bdellovibrionales bacterium GWA1_52_35]OFZ39953.1 MAG: hypothetical protein A2070_07880 [Bdellovibrionales bacterium GWC1_52_8]HCM40154.1 hypothetical protein [Bdellovibrionales bacterium]